jgi:hypothetical protein
VQLKQVAQQIPWAGVEAAAILVVRQAVYAAKTTHAVKAQHKNTVLLIRLNLNIL